VAKVVRGFAVPDADAWPLLQAWNARCVPPWNDAELRDKMANAHKYGSEPYGATLDAPPPARQDRAELPRAAADWRAERGAGDPPGELDDAPPVEGDGGEPAPLAVPVEALGWLDLHPPPLPLLLACDDGTGGRAPFLALGKVALLAAPGGAGKTQALLQLAVAVASGRPWLDRYHVQAPGPVLFLAAEEDDGELHRRVRRVADALDLAPAERAAVARRLHCAPLHGKGAALALLDNAAHRFEPARLAPSAIWHRIAWTLETAPGGEPWRLVILDPAARWMPPDAELDPKIATTFVEVLEALAVCGLDGGPGAAVLVAHHANKQALRGDTDQGASRGTSALTDGVRWQANLDRVPLADGKPHPSRVRLRVVKCNYAPAVAFETLELEKDQDKGGVLCPCQDAVADAAGEKDDEALENHREKLNVRQAGVNERVRQADEVREKLRAHDEKEPPPLELEKRQAWQKARDRLVKDLEQAERSAKKARNDLLEKQAELAALERAQERNASKGGSKGSKGRDKAAGGGDDY
ncbi:MAG: hypothetical protein FJ255_12505, partial [Phycisphaerae bacterium]|nr:hypothetical protein [Phycisphaerae bacterium]